ncbi:MAG TPA: hypothetical protein DCP28_35145 [Cytophagales bacterium]|nr:hypothetical protein [Cytophagales bacterium]
MKNTTYLVFAVLVFLGSVAFNNRTTNPEAPEERSGIEEAPDSEAPEYSEPFDVMMSVLTHQRCVNCHPSDDVPKQGEDRHAHRFDITRGNSTGPTNCNTCHQAENNDFSGVPGAPDWSLAPHSMRWEGLSRIEIAESMMDPERNGGRTAEDIMHHLTEHELVLWAWEPGIKADGTPRELPPVSKENYVAAVKAWIEEGAVIPAE